MRLIAILIIYISLFLPARAQQPSGRAELEKQRQNILQAIKETEDQLEATKMNKNATMGQLHALQSKLAERQRLIGNINSEIGEINNNIQTSTNEVNHLRGNLDVLKQRYAQSVRYAYKTRSSYDMLAFLFSSKDFNEALRRLKYLKKYRDYRKQQADQIRITQGQIVNKIGVLNNQKSQKDVLLSAEEQQKLVLQKESNETNQVVKDLKGKEKQLLAEIEKNRKAAKQVDRAVAEYIRREMEAARKKAEEEARLLAEKQRKEEEARRAAAAANSGYVNVVTGSGTRTIGPQPAPSGNPTKQTTTTQTSRPSNNQAAQTTTTTTYVKPQPKDIPNLSMTPEAAALSNSFEFNRGKLPWPVEKGFISEGFGRHQHPVAEKVVIENYGVDIRTNANAAARAVFDGKVTKVFYISGGDWNVLINHGRYFTLYSRLSSVSVKQDQMVHTKQQIGVVGINDDGEAIINFQIWKDGNKIDPAGWIAR